MADTSLEQAEKSVALLGATIDNVANTLQTTSEMTASIAGIFGDSLGSVVSKTQQALGTMEASAKLIDDTLGFISAIPFMRVDYDPNMPLAASVADISDSLDPLPENLTAVQGDMENTSENLGSMDKKHLRAAGEHSRHSEKLAGCARDRSVLSGSSGRDPAEDRQFPRQTALLDERHGVGPDRLLCVAGDRPGRSVDAGPGNAPARPGGAAPPR